VQLGKLLRGSEVIELISDLGGGKTTFVRGIANGAGSKDRVASPTFTVSKVYAAPNFDIHHFDFYRLEEAGLLVHELADYIGDPKSVVIIEWGKIVSHVLPQERLSITITKTGDESRHYTFKYPDSLNYLIGDLQ
jgi:tRNA threonylcarbamoyladenosine biosynthesis protein TsaE